MKFKEELEDIRPKGNVTMTITDKRDGSIVDTFEDHNIVVLDARKILIKLIYEGLTNYYVNVAKIGSDVGDGNEDDPEEPDENVVASDMNVLYTITDEISVSYSGDLLTVYNIFISGEDVMDQYPGEDSVFFTSIGLFSDNDILFSYRRFPARTITENFNVNIIWEIFYPGGQEE